MPSTASGTLDLFLEEKILPKEESVYPVRHRGIIGTNTAFFNTFVERLEGNIALNFFDVTIIGLIRHHMEGFRSM